MKIKQKLIIMSSMLCIVLSLVAVCFSIAWYAMYPVFNELNLTIGDSALTVCNQVFLRSKDSTSFKPSWGGTLGKDYNVKIHKENTSAGVNPDEVNSVENGTNVVKDNDSGLITINFPDLTYNLFNMLAPDSNIIDQDGGLLDKDTMSIDIRYFTFALVELTFHNGFFSNYLYSDIKVNLTTSNTTTTAIDLTPYKSNLIQLRVLQDTNSNNKNLHFIDPKATTPDENIKTLENYATTSIPLTFDTPHPFFDGYTGGQGATPYQIEVEPNPNRNPNVEAYNYYSYALAFSLSFDPIQFMKLFKAYNHIDTSFNLSIVLNFNASGNELGSVEGANYEI